MTSSLPRFIAVPMLSLVLVSCASTPSSFPGQSRETVDPAAAFDLSDYLFHKSLNFSGGGISYTEKYYRKNEGVAPAAQYRYEYRKNGNVIDVKAIGLEGLANRYTVTDSIIRDDHPSLNDSRSFQRYARLGDTFIDHQFDKINVSENCVLSEFFTTMHLSSATGLQKLSDHTYDNVIRVRCLSEFTDRPINRENYRWSVYYAKGIGPVFKDGNWANHLGQIYSIYEY